MSRDDLGYTKDALNLLRADTKELQERLLFQEHQISNLVQERDRLRAALQSALAWLEHEGEESAETTIESDAECRRITGGGFNQQYISMLKQVLAALAAGKGDE